MKMMTLKFASHSDIWEFLKLIKSNDAEVNLTDCTVYCEVEKEEIDLAAQRFGAQAEPESIR